MWAFRLALMSCAASVTFAGFVRSDETRMERGPNGELRITIQGVPDAVEGTHSNAAQKDSRADAAREQASVRFSLKRTELEKQMNSTAADLQRTREAIRDTERQRFEAYAAGDPFRSDTSVAVAMVAESANKFEQNKRFRLEDLRTKERETLRRLLMLYTDAAELHEDITNFYGGQMPPWWRDVRCESCPTPSEVAAALR
jgi:hypothetical protein